MGLASFCAQPCLRSWVTACRGLQASKTSSGRIYHLGASSVVTLGIPSLFLGKMSEKKTRLLPFSPPPLLSFPMSMGKQCVSAKDVMAEKYQQDASPPGQGQLITAELQRQTPPQVTRGAQKTRCLSHLISNGSYLLMGSL